MLGEVLLQGLAAEFFTMCILRVFFNMKVERK